MDVIAQQAIELTELKSITKEASNKIDPNKLCTSKQVSGEPVPKKTKQISSIMPYYPIVFNQKPDGNATEPVVRILMDKLNIYFIVFFKRNDLIGLKIVD